MIARENRALFEWVRDRCKRTPIGKTPVFFNNVISEIHTLRVKDLETTIDVKPDETLKISLFKGKLINIPFVKKGPVIQLSIEEEKDKESWTIQQSPKE